MAYRRTYGSRDWSSWHTSQLSKQAGTLGGIDEDVREAFLALKSSQLLNFFFHYEKRYGLGARSYAEQAFMKWKVGSTRMSAQTTDRLLQVLPPFLGTQVKYDLLRKLRERYRQSESHQLEVTTLNYKGVVKPVVERLVSKAYSANLPESIESRLKWLTDDDASAAKSLMAGAEAAAMKITLSRLDEEFAAMDRLLLLNPKGKLTHRIELPYGVLTLLVRRGTTVEESNKSSELTVRPSTDSTSITSSDQLLRNAIRNLTPEQMSQISLKATEEAVNLQTESLRADQRFINAKRDVDSFVDSTRKLEAQQGDYKSSATFNTASGTTSYSVSKNQSKTWIIAVVALAVLVILLVLSRK
jgi:hypothetical protein